MPNLKDILKQVQLLEIRSKRLSNHVFAGEYHSAFKGRGMSFKEVREYSPGDDIRFIDWNVSARFGHPFSKVFEEERSLTVMLLLDLSASQQLGSRNKTKAALMAELAAVLAFSAHANNDKVGAIFFTDKVEQFIAPAKGRQHVLYLLRQLLSFEPASRATHFEPPLRLLRNLMKHTTISFLISDFHAPDFSRQLKATAVRHDCVAIHLFDQLEIQLPTNTLLPVQDAESGETRWLDTHASGFNKAWEGHFAQRTQSLKQEILQSGWDYLRFRTDHDFVPVLQQFFLNRTRKK
jgi:uncharacterized protein (DUF58 family)